ncbi:MAG: sulfotransferase [Gemmatimonadota bacterium]
MKGTRWKRTLRHSLALLHRELRITLTPVPSPRAWVFVVGCYNSGTTLLSDLLGRHSRISVLPEEGQFLTDELTSDYEFGLPRMWTMREDRFRLTEEDRGPDPQRLKREWGMRLDLSRPILVEKSPPNAARTRWLQEHFENAHFVAIVRNGYAVAEGIHRKGDPRHRQGWPIEACARQWARSNEVLLEDSPLLRHLLWVRYEDLSARPREELARITGFLELDPDELAYDPDERLAVHERHEPLRNLNEQSIARLAPEDVATITRVAGPMLAHFDYAMR